MRKSDRLIKAGLLTAIIGLVSILNIFAFRATQQPPMASAVRGVAYFDCNYNGLKEVGETGFPNMDVLLTGRNSLGDTITQMTTTDGAGLYAFTGIDAGTYRVKYAFPGTSVNLIFSPQNIGGDDGADSDPNAAGYTDSLFVDGITDIGAVDAGVIDSVCPVIYYTNPLIATLLDGDTLTVGCDNIPAMDGTWAVGVNNSGGANLPVVFERVLVRNGNCKQDGFVQFFVCTWTAQNLCNHQTQVRLYLKTIDTVPPTLTAPNDTTINLMLGDVVPAVPSSIPNNDNCSGTGSTVTYIDYETADSCGKIITRIWAAEDACGNQTIDTQRITVVLNALCTGAPATDTIVLAPFTMTGNTKDTCLAAYLGSDRVLKNTWTLSSTNGVSATVIGDSCVTLTRQPGFSGRDTMAGWHCDGANANCRFFLLVVNILPDDPSCNLVAVDTLVPLSVTCGSQGLYCLTGLNDINNFNNTYSIADNGAAYSGSFNSCSKDTTFSYAYYTLPFMGLSGKYRLDYWKLNGSNVTIASFDSLPQLVAVMNLNDPTGNWAIDSANYTITGGTTAQTYGQIRVTKLSNGAVGTSNVATNIANNGILMAFTGGLHTVIFTKTLTGCTDTLNVNVFCDTILLPVAVNDVATTKKNIGITINTFVNDTLNGALIKPLSIITNPINGLATVDGSNIIAYIPTVGFCGGNDSLSYEICNADGCDTAWVYVTINCPQPPVALDDVTSTTKNTDVTISALANDTTHGALTQLLSIVTNPTNGTATVDGSNIITFSPTLDFCGGNDSLSYEICNADGCDTAWVYLTINCPAVIGDPVAVDDNVIANKNTNLYFSPLVNDTINGTLLALGTVTAPKHGSVGFVGVDSLVYTPLVDYCGNDTIEYRVCRTDFKCDTAFIYITVNCPVPGLAPVALDDAVLTDKNVGITITALANDTTNGVLIQPLSIINYVGGATISVDGSNNIVYTPASNFCGGNDTFSYEICNANGCDTATVVVTVNCPPVLLYPIALTDTISTLKNVAINIDVLANDTTNGGLSQSAVIIQNPSNGTASFNVFNTIDYTPTMDFCGGNDTLSYEICNVNGCDTGWVFITVNCPPIIIYPIAVNDVVSTDKNVGITINAIANDILNGALISPLSIVGYAGNAMVSVDGSNNIVYTPELDFCGGNDTLGYEICTATGCDTGWVFVTINCPAPVLYPVTVNDVVSTLKNTSITIAALANDTTNGALIKPLSIVGYSGLGMITVDGSNNIVYSPEPSFCGGNELFGYEICNANGCDTGWVFVTVNCPPAPKPDAVDDVATTTQTSFVVINVPLNDIPNGVLTRTTNIVRAPSNGFAIVNFTNKIVYTPALDFCGGNDTMSYEICNAVGCDTATVVVTVNCPAILYPIAVDDAVTTTKNNGIVIEALLNDTLNGVLISPLSIFNYTGSATVSVDGSNNIVYIPAVDFCGGNDTVMYEICTATGCDTGWAFITINCPPIVYPIAADDAVSTNKNSSVTISVLSNDVTNGALVSSVSIINYAGSATVSVDINDNIVYTPALDFCGGNDTVYYSLCNASGCDTGKVVITINCPAVGLFPIAVNDAVSTLKNASITINALSNDTINGGLKQSIQIIQSPTKGTANVNGFNYIVYNPQSNYCGGQDSLSYEICNANGCDTAWVYITINCPALVPPIANNDAVSTLKNASITITALANDNTNGALISPLSIITNPSNGTASVDGSNRIVYTPDLDFCGGNDILTYAICNADGCDTAIVVMTINCPLPVLPIANNDAVSTLKNTGITVSVLLNDNTNGALISPLSIINYTGSATVYVDGSNNISYTPFTDTCGFVDTLTYRICNADGCDTATLLVTVTCPLKAPIAIDDAISLDKNTFKLFKPTVNDTLNGSLFAVNIITSPTNGAIGFISIDSLIYTPFIGFCGTDTITYSVCNQGSLCDTATIIATIICTDTTGNSQRPVAVDDAVSTLKNTSINIAVIANDTVNGALSQPLSISGNPKYGTAVVNGNQITYSPALDFCGGSDTLSYVICNANGCDTGWAFISVNCTGGNNNANQPIALDDNVSTSRNTPFIFQPTKNDTLKGTLASLNIVSTAKHGTLAFAGIDSLVYYPQAGYCGNDTMIYSICNQFSLCDTATIIVNITCDTVPTGNGKLPIAVDDLATTLKNTAVNIAVLTNDTINGGLTRPLSILGNSSNGTAVVLANDIIYTPQAGFCGGIDTVSYEICNANGCDTGWVFVTVNCPIIILKPDAVNDLVTTTKNTQVVIDVLANDTKNGTLTRTTNIIRQPSRGTAIVNFTNKIVYIPQAGFCGGSDTLTYEICNADGCDTALVIIDIQCVGTNPDAVDDVATVNKNVSTTLSVLSNDAVNGTLIRPLSILTQPTNGTAAVDANNNISYTPTTNFCGGNDTLTYEICNNNGCDTAKLIITVSCAFVVNRPDAVDDYTTTFKNTGINIDALTNDQLNGVLDSISIINAPKHGVASVNGLKIQYQPDSTFCGSNDTMSYSICTSNGCDTAQIIVNVTCDIVSNTPPDAVDDARSTIQARSLTMVVLANDLLHGAALDSAKIVQVPRHGSARFDAFGNIFYDPNPNFCGGNDTLTYQICTRYGCDTAQVVITVTCDSLFNVLPIATIDNAATARNISIIIPVLQNDTLNGADTFRIITFGKHGSAIFNNNNEIVYQPDSIFCNGKDTLVYQICNIAGCSTAKVIIDVTCDSIAKLIPIANADTATTKSNEPVMIDITSNDTLRGANKPVIVGEPKKGIVTITGDNKALYIPNTDAFGRDTFSYVICNAFGCDTTKVGVFIMAGDSVKIFNGFSPNNDGMNDRFVIKGIENYPNNEVYIYNRWGVEVYKTKGYTNDNGWDGSWLGTYLPDGTYFIVIVYNDELKQRKTGYIQIHR